MGANPVDLALLATKLFVPRPRPNRVDRARLRDQLDAARGGTVALAAAPAGSGKSTLLADWALGAQRRVAWLSLDPGDDEPCRFLNYVIAALKNAGALGDEDVFATVSAPSAIDAVLTEVLNAVTDRHAEVALVLDDYHVIESPRVHAIVQRMIDHLPPDLQLVIASRIDPPLALSRLRARGTLLEIRASDLRFTQGEAERFFNESMDLGLTGEEVAELETRTEGWAVGLQMAAISLRGREGAKHFITSFSGSNRYVLDYLTEEVLHRQPAEVRSFLLETSILTDLAAPLCNAVAARDDSDGILRLLDSGNLFLIPLDDARYWYRYHHLFGSLLQHELARTMGAESVAELHRRAAAWYASNAMPEKALHHALAAHNDDQAVDIVLRNAPSRLATGDGATIVRWIAQLPRERVENEIDLLILHARALTTAYDVANGMHEITRAAQLLDDTNRATHQGPVLSVRGMLENLGGEGDRAFATLDQALSLLDPNGFWYSMTSLHIGVAALIAGDLQKAEEYCARATAYRGEDGLLTAVFGNAYGAMAALWHGTPDRAMQMVTEANAWIDAWTAKHGSEGPLGSLTNALLADAHLMWNDLPAARAYGQRAMELAKKGLLIAHCEASRLLSHVAAAQRDWDAALGAARESFRSLRCTGNEFWASSAASLEYNVLWLRGQSTGNRADLEQVERWCEENGLLDVDHWRERLQPGLLPDNALMIGARVLIYRQRYAEAERLTDALFDEALRRERIPGQISTLVLRSIAEAARGRMDVAAGSMSRALDIAAKPRYIYFLLDGGSAAAPIIERAAARAADRDFALRVLAAFDVPVSRRLAQPLAEPLSEREVEVLRLIASGVSNVAAARKLFVAPSTVKKHLENIYAKLSVGGRTEAVARARELQIL